MVMAAHTIKDQTGKILVVGPLYDRIDKLTEIETYFDKYELIVFNGNLCYPYDNPLEVCQRLDAMSKLLTNPKVKYNLGNHDLLFLNKVRKELDQEKIYNWLRVQDNVIIVKFRGGNTLIITSGGVTPEMSLKDLIYNTETSFVSNIQDKPWHQSYGGGMGYIISNNPLTQTPPQFHNFSAQMGNSYSNKTITYMLEVGCNGVGRTFSVMDPQWKNAVKSGHSILPP